MGTDHDTGGSGIGSDFSHSEASPCLIHPSDPKGAEGAKKAPLGLIPPQAEIEAAWAHAEGAKKYGPWNWRKTGVNSMTYASAIKRHLNAWIDREDIDPDSGLSHIAKIIASCNILIDARHHGTLTDDRPPKP